MIVSSQRQYGQNGFNGAGKVLVLTFTNNSFVLQVPPGVEMLRPGADWVRYRNDRIPYQYTTTNIKAAARFRSHADSKAEMIFNKLMLQNIALPAGGVLSPKGLKLYDFQENFGVPHILGSSKTYLAHQPGLGKSAQAICAVNTKPGRTLLIVPSFLRITWAREITKWFHKDFPSIAVVPVTAKAHKTNWGADFVIVPDSMLARPWVSSGLLRQKFRFEFIDEGHRFKTQDVARTVALFGGRIDGVRSPGLIYNSEHVCMLSGTPLLNRPIELWPALYAMAPELIDFMPYEDFGYHYGGAVQDDRGHWRFVGSANEKELKNRIMGRFMQRIRKKDVLKELPPKIREAIFIDSDTRKEDVKALDRELMQKLGRTKINKPQNLGDYAVLDHQNGLSKVDWSSEYIANILSSDTDEQILVGAHHRDVVAGLAKALKAWGPMVINGGTSLETRTKIEDLFQANKRRLIIGNIRSMNLGLTLTAGSRVIFVEWPWSPSEVEQFEDRLHRIGTVGSILSQFLVLAGMDEVKLNAVLKKEQRIAKVMD